jgi:hypothetical protein
MTHDDNDNGPVTFVDMVLVLLENQFPWLATRSQDAISGADTIDQLSKLYASLLRQPTAQKRTYFPYVSESHSLYRDQPRCDRDSENLAAPGKVLHTTTS